MCGGGGSKASNRLMQEQLDLQKAEVERQRQQEAEREGRITEGMSFIDDTFNGLEAGGSNIYGQRERAYRDYANPQLDQQYGDARKDMTARLWDMGHGMGSSTAIDRTGRLGEDYALGRSGIADTALDYANQARQQTSQERSRLTSMLQASADPSAIQGQMGSVVDSLRAAPAFNAIGPIFQNATAGLGSYLDGMRFNQMSRSANSVPIYGSGNSGSGRVVR